MTVKTKNGDATVKMSKRDWVGLLSVAATLLLFIVSGYLRNDRLLTEVLIRQSEVIRDVAETRSRIERIEGIMLQ